jgi:AcrR family transcriptional regulator
MRAVSDAVKGSRAYHSPRREAQAAATRAEIIQAANRLFVADGYVRTTLADIAKAAGVAVPTVKLNFGSKRLVLVAVWDWAVKGGPDTRPVVDQEWFKAMIATPDPHEHLRLQAEGSVQVKERIAPVIEVMRAAAASDDEIAALWAKNQAEFVDNQRHTIKALQRKGTLRDGLSEDEATDVLYTLNHPTVYHMLVVTQGWTPQKYQAGGLSHADCLVRIGK